MQVKYVSGIIIKTKTKVENEKKFLSRSIEPGTASGIILLDYDYELKKRYRIAHLR